MLEKEVFLKKVDIKFFVIIIFLITNSYCVNAYSDQLKIINYLKDFNKYSLNFIQDDGANISEGLISIGEDRVRVHYYLPTEIIIILSKNKAMYYNKELDEDEFFNPKDTPAYFFYNIFRNPEFFISGKIVSFSNTIVLEKEALNNSEKYNIKLYFENNPLILRKVELTDDLGFVTLSLFNHQKVSEFDKNHFKLINPNFFK